MDFKKGTQYYKLWMILLCVLALGAFSASASKVEARPNYYGGGGGETARCSLCHGDTPTTCNGCHQHGPRNLNATTDKTTYAPGEALSVTFTGGQQSGWIRAILYLNNQEVARSTGPTGMGGGAGFPITFSTTAPTTPGTYSYEAAWFGNTNNSGPSNPTHGEVRVSSNSFTVSAPAAPTITTSSLPAGTVGTAYSQSLSASGGTTPYSWSVTSGSLPAGLSLGSGGTISGTPTSAGTSTFTVQVSGGGTATKSLSITVNPASLQVTTSSLPAGTVGTAYSQSLSASGGTTPYSWSVTSGSLPAGLSLGSGGTISGTPTSAGTSTFTVQVSGGGTATKSLSVTVNPETPPPTTETLTLMPEAGSVEVPVTTVVSVTGDGSAGISNLINMETFSLMEGPSVAMITGQSESDGNDHHSCVSEGIVLGDITYNTSNTVATFTPFCKLAYGTTYTATIMAVTDTQKSVISEPTSWSFTTIAQTPDTDDDGVEDGEDDHPRDKKKATPPSSRGRGKFLVDISADASASLGNVEGISDASIELNQTGKPSSFEFVDGMVRYTVEGVPPGGTVAVKVTCPGGIPSGSKVYRSDARGFHEVAGAVINGSTVTLTLTDGGTGDADGLPNGVIVDPVGVAVPVASGTGSIDLGAEAAGGGCSVAGAGGGWKEAVGSYGLLALVWLGLALRRRKPESGE